MSMCQCRCVIVNVLTCQRGNVTVCICQDVNMTMCQNQRDIQSRQRVKTFVIKKLDQDC